MRKFLLSLLMLLATVSPIKAQWSNFGLVEKTTFQTYYEDATGQGQMGTAFCVPGKSTLLVTASHTIGVGLAVYDHKGEEYTPKVMYNDPKKDVGILMLDKESPCLFSNLKWAPENAPIGTPAWLYGYGGGMRKPIMTTGIVSGTVGTRTSAMGMQIAQLNALFGHSGGPVLDSKGQIIGMLVGGFNSGDVMDLIVPVEVLKKVVR